MILPTVCCPRLPAPGKRYKNSCRSSSGASDRPTMQRKISPHGCTPNSSRRRPLLPPLSAAVTIAVTLRSFSSLTRLSPASTCDCPAPPPMVTIFLFIAVLHLPFPEREDQPGSRSHPAPAAHLPWADAQPCEPEL